MKKRFTILMAACIMLLTLVLPGTAFGDNFSQTYVYGGTDWTRTNFTDEGSYYKSTSNNDGIATIPGIFTGRTITSNVVITLNVACYGNGSNPTSSKFSIYTSSACTTQVTATQSGTLPNSSTYTNTTYTVTLANAASFSDDLAVKVAKGTKLIRLKSIKVEFSYTSATPTVATPTFSPADGFYTLAQNVTISTTTPAATIYYTTDGTNPTTSSTQYTGAISVTSTTTIKAMATATGYNNSSVATANYVILQHAGTQADPYSVADARAAIDVGSGVTGVYVAGIVCNGGSNLSSGAMNYWISDDGTQTNKLEAYKGKGIDGADFTSTNDVQVGDVVVIYGTLTKYNSTYEFASGNQLVSLVREYTVTYDGNGATSGDVPAVPTAYSSGATVTVLGNTGNLTKTYCSFSGWNTKANGSGTPYVADNTFNIRENTTLYAQWTGESRTITYKAGAGSGSDVEAPTHYGDSYTIASNTFTAPTGKPTFTGWNTKIDGSGESYSPGQIITVSDDLILFAQWANLVTVTYTITSTTSVTVSGTAPTGSGVTYSQTHNTACQMTSGNSMTLTLTGYTGQVIKSITLSMKSNTGSGAGNMLAKVGETNLASIATAAFNTASWNGAWSTSYVDITPTMSNSTHLIQSGENVVIQIAATANSLYCQSFTIIYDLSTQPVINADDVEIDADATSGEIAYTISNPDGNTLAAAEKAPGYNWIDNVTVVGAQNKVTFTTTANAGASREGYITLTYGSVTKDVKVTQAAPPVDYAFLPFNWAGGTTTELENENGVSTYGLGSDYAAQNAPYYQKMDGVGDYIQIKTDSQPSIVTIGVKMIGGANTSKIKIQESTDGSEFTDVEELTISGAQNTVLNLTTNTLFNAETRYVRIIKSVHGHNIGVGPISIYKNMPAPTVDGNNEIVSDVTINNGEYLIISSLIKIPSGRKITVSNKGVLVNTNPANLIIEDGGQLILPGSGSKTGEDVKATFQKEITKYTGDKDHYYLIANPTTGAINPANVEGMVVDQNANSMDYDLYYFDEEQSGAEWRNYRQGAFNLVNGKGYLYAKRSNITLQFSGTVPTGTTASITLSKSGSGTYNGFNLVGNPLSNNITSMNIEGEGCYYYKLNSSTGVFAASEADIIVGEAFMVEAPNNGDKLYLNTTPPPSGKDEAGFTNEVIRLEVSNSKFTDVAYVYFGNHLPLTKINHLNDEAPMLYIHNENSDKAVEVYNNRGEVKSINVNFEAKTIGTYTISAKMVKGEIKYMHLYDRFTSIDTDLLIDDYSFIGANEDQPGRFILKLEAIDNEFEGSDNFAYQSGNNIMVNGEGELQIFDVMGRMVMNERINGVESISGLSRGIYIFRVIGETQKTQKIVVR